MLRLAHYHATMLEQTLGLVVIAAAIVAIARQWEVRAVVLTAALLLGFLAHKPEAVVQTFLATLSDETSVIPICTALGFSYVVRHTGCDQHLIHLLMRPLSHVRWLLIPGTVMVGFLVNMPIVSQTGTAATLGPVVIPICRTAGLSPATTGAALLLGSSMGGELFNPGAPEYTTVVSASNKAYEQRFGDDPNRPHVTADQCVRQAIPLNLLSLAVGASLLWWFARRWERTEPTPVDSATASFRVQWWMAMVPLVPLVLLYIAAPPLEWIEVPRSWLTKPESARFFEGRLIGAAMVVGVVVAAAAVPSKSPTVMSAFFEGAGYGYTHVISLIVAAKCFGQGIFDLGFAQWLGNAVTLQPGLLLPAAALLCMAFAALCGSGIAATQTMFNIFAQPALDADIDPVQAGVVVAIASAAGRTMSPVAAVTLMNAKMTETPPLELARRVALPLFASTASAVILAMLMR